MQRIVGFGDETGRRRGWRAVPRHRGWIWFSLAILFTFLLAVSALLFLDAGAVSRDDPLPIRPETEPVVEPAAEPMTESAIPTGTQP